MVAAAAAAAAAAAIWLCHMALPYGLAIWPCHMTKNMVEVETKKMLKLALELCFRKFDEIFVGVVFHFKLI